MTSDEYGRDEWQMMERIMWFFFVRSRDFGRRAMDTESGLPLRLRRNVGYHLYTPVA